MLHTSVEDPMNRSSSDYILVVSNEIGLLPYVTEEAVDLSLTDVGGTVKPIRAKDSNFQLSGGALAIGIEGIEEWCTVVPLEVVLDVSELMLDDVKVMAIGPIVPKIY